MGYNQTTSEMGHLYYESLGKLAGGPLGDTTPFQDLLAFDYYWSVTEYSLNPDRAWVFDFHDGWQATGTKVHGVAYGLAVRPGNVSGPGINPIPIPSAFWLLGSGLIAFVGGRKKFRRQKPIIE